MMKYFDFEICGVKRKLPYVKIADDKALASFVVISDTELVQAVAPELVKRLPEVDYLMTAEAKGICLCYEMSRLLGMKEFLSLIHILESTATMAGSTTPMARERRSSSCSSHRREISSITVSSWPVRTPTPSIREYMAGKIPALAMDSSKAWPSSIQRRHSSTFCRKMCIRDRGGAIPLVQQLHPVDGAGGGAGDGPPIFIILHHRLSFSSWGEVFQPLPALRAGLHRFRRRLGEEHSLA